MSPILVRPVREQLEHDRIIRLLQASAGASIDAGMNPGAEQNAAVGTGAVRVLSGPRAALAGAGHRLQVIVEVETGESVNHLEALAAMGAFLQASRRLSPLRACGDGRCRASAVRGQPDPRHRNLELSQRRRRGAVRPDSSLQGTPVQAPAPRKDHAPAPDSPAKRKIAPVAKRPAVKGANRSRSARCRVLPSPPRPSARLRP